MSDLFSELIEELQVFQISADEDVLLKFQEFCSTYGFNAEDMVGSWIAYCSTRSYDMEPTPELLSQFEREELMKVFKNTRNRKSQSIKQKFPTYDPDEFVETGELSVQSTPKSQISPSALPFSPDSFSTVSGTPSVKYASRKTSGEVVCSNKVNENVSWASKHSSVVSVSAFDEPEALLKQYNCMFEKFRDYATILNDLIDDIAMKFQEKYQITEWANVGAPVMEPMSYVGRICAESGNKLNPQSLILEGSLETSSGSVTPLNVETLREFSFFPGHIIAGQGINSTGKNIQLQSLFEEVMPMFPKNPPSVDVNNGLSVVIASGPFTTSDNLLYEPLEDLMNYLKINEPDVCILLGPIIDEKHEEVKNGNLSSTYYEIFSKILNKVMNHLENTRIKVVLVSSARDAHNIPVYPTPPYDIKHDFKNLYLVSDPSILNIDNVIFGITSTDILMHLGKEEIHISSQSSDRLGRLCKHIIKQQNFYPLYPPSEDMNIDYVRFESHCLLPVSPHILILPSDLRNFIKNINGCCSLNPERLAKGLSGGMFARIIISPIDSDKYSGSIMDFIQAEIVRI